MIRLSTKHTISCIRVHENQPKTIIMDSESKRTIITNVEKSICIE